MYFFTDVVAVAKRIQLASTDRSNDDAALSRIHLVPLIDPYQFLQQLRSLTPEMTGLVVVDSLSNIVTCGSQRRRKCTEGLIDSVGRMLRKMASRQFIPIITTNSTRKSKTNRYETAFGKPWHHFCDSQIHTFQRETGEFMVELMKSPCQTRFISSPIVVYPGGIR